MNEHDFFTRYAELMKSIEPSEELVEEVAAPSRADDYVGSIYSAPANSHVTCIFAYAIPSHFATDENVYVMVSGKLFPVNA